MDNPHVQFECGEYPGISCGILSIPHNIVMDLNNVMHIYVKICEPHYTCPYMFWDLGSLPTCN